MDQQSLYDRLGGSAAVTAVIDAFVARCAAVGRINPKFARTDVARLKSMLVDQVSEATGGLRQFGVPDAAQGELLGILGPLRGDIVEVESPATGTALPETYQSAPPLAGV